MKVATDEILDIEPQWVRRFVGVLENHYMAWAILFVSLVLTLIAWLISNSLMAQRTQERFTFRAKTVTAAIEERMLEYEQVLRGGIGLHAASEQVSREEWRIYVKNCELSRYFPGIQGMGVAVPVTPERKDQHEAEIRAEGFSDYQVRPTDDRDFYTSIVYIEPFDWRNQRAFGYDMYSESTRREAMDRAIETGDPAMSGMVTLVQETDEDVQQGCLFYLPIFPEAVQSDGDESVAPETFQTRRDRLSGLVYAAFRINDLMSGILPSKADDIKYEIYDAPEITEKRLLYDSDQTPHFNSNTCPAYSSDIQMTIRGRTWTLHFESCPGLFKQSDNFQGMFVAFGGLTVDFLLFLVIATIGRQKRVALELASDMTKDVRAREELIRNILDNASEAIITIDGNGDIELLNGAAQAMFGLPLTARKNVQFESCLQSQSWQSLVEKLESADVGHCTCTVQAMHTSGKAFPCRLNLGSFVANGHSYHILVAQDESSRLESERMLHEINTDLIQASRTAGKVELANGVLHNVGNIINSINISTTVIKTQLDKSAVSNLDRVCSLISDHESEFGDFVNNYDRGRKIPNYLLRIRDSLVGERMQIDDELHDLLKNVSHIKQVITSQQSEARSSGKPQRLFPAEVVDDAVIANKSTLANHDVEIVKQVATNLPELYSDKHQILQILVNLIKNAYDALVEYQTSIPIIIVRVSQKEKTIRFEVIDNGIGISSDSIDNIFTHGFTTKSMGHGFGLHSSASTAVELGGSLQVSSDGVGRGATFELSLPINPYASAPSNDFEQGASNCTNQMTSRI